MTSGDAQSGPSAPDNPGRTDAELLRAHVDGDPQAFNDLIRRHRDRLWAVALRTIGDREEAADAVQDALLSAHRGAAKFRGESAVTTWLHRIVVNACLDRIRRRQAHPTVPLPDGSRSDDGPGGPEPAAPVQDHDTALVVRAALAALPVEQRAALVLVDVQGYPVIEAAEILGVAEGTIKSRCARGRARMALALGHLRTGSDTPDPGSAAAGPAGTRPAAGPSAAAETGAVGAAASAPTNGPASAPGTTPTTGPATATGTAAATGPAAVAGGGDGDHAGNRGATARVPSGSAAAAPHLSARDGSVADRGDQQ